MINISIIIPVYNESENINKLLNHLDHNITPENIEEIIIVDGGSKDGTIDKLRSVRFLKPDGSNTLRLVSSDKGRAIQMNSGAKNATGSILYFLHADSFPPKNFDQHIIDSVKNGNKAGCFRMQFDSNHWWLKLAGWLTALPWKICRGGDQSLFITKSLFFKIGGYNEDYTICEDSELISRLYKKHRFVVIPKWLKTSARNYKKHGILKTQYYYWRIYFKKRIGVSPKELHRYYQEKILKS